jgi:hypothetical protein
MFGLSQPIALEMNRSDYMIGTVEKDIVCASASTTESGDKSNGCQCPASRQCDVTGRSGRCATNSVSLMQTEFNTMSAGAAGLAGNANKLHRSVGDVTLRSCIGRLRCTVSVLDR